MGLEQKAFVFDYAAFELELKPILERALAGDDVSETRLFH